MVRFMGDSHSVMWSEVIPRENIHHLGGRTAYKIDTRREKIEGLLNEYPEDTWYIVLGEIDCRIHILDRAIREDMWPKDVFERTVSRYQKFLDTVPRLNVVLVAPMGESKLAPALGSWEFRQLMVRKWNESMVKWAEKNNRKTISIWPGVTLDERGLPLVEDLDGSGVHLLPSVVKKAWEITGGEL